MLARQPITRQAIGPATIPLPEFAMANWRLNGSRGSHVRKGVTVRTDPNIAQHTPCSDRPTLDQRVTRFGQPARRRVRIALYSHDTMGLGHLRRNLVIAQSLAESSLEATTLLISGAHSANFFSLPERADLLTLPRLQKNPSGDYSSGQLDISVQDLISLRADSICSALEAFLPDVLIVDKVPAGAFGEMLPALRSIKRHSQVKCVLGIRDVLDDPETVRLENDKPITRDTIEEFYDDIWVYGDSQVYDPVNEYRWSKQMADKVRFTGYLDQSRRLRAVNGQSHPVATTQSANKDRLVVCTLGGGQDGFALAKAFIEGLPTAGVRGILLTGPFMPGESMQFLHQAEENRDNLEILKFIPEADQLVSHADCVIAMGGYNTVCSILSFAKRALIVPRVAPRLEQWIRAERLQKLDLVDVLHPRDLSPIVLHDWIEGGSAPPRRAAEVVNMDGLANVEKYCKELIGTRPAPQPRHSRDLV